MPILLLMLVIRRVILGFLPVDSLLQIIINSSEKNKNGIKENDY